MSWLTDQITLKDVTHVIQRFYDKARTNDDIGHFFSSIEDFEAHEKKIAAFWWLALGGKLQDLPTPAPSFDMIAKHIALGISGDDILVWRALFEETLYKELKPEVADIWKLKMQDIANHLKALAIDGKSAGLQIQEPRN